MIEIKNKRAFLTGASRGIGQQIAFGLAKRGCNLVLQARKLENLKTTLEGLKSYDVDVKTIAAELSDPESVESMLKEVDDMDVTIDIVYNCAAIMSKPQEIFASDRKEWDRVMEVDFYSLVTICEHFLPRLCDQGFGRVVNVSSGIQDQPRLAPYSVAKAAVDRYTRDLAPSMKEKGVLMNVIDPGWIKTDLGGPNAFSEVASVLPGMLVPVLMDEASPVGAFYRAQDYVGLEDEALEAKVKVVFG